MSEPHRISDNMKLEHEGYLQQNSTTNSRLGTVTENPTTYVADSPRANRLRKPNDTNRPEDKLKFSFLVVSLHAFCHSFFHFSLSIVYLIHFFNV